MSINEKNHLLTELAGLLEKQINLARQGVSTEIEILAEKCEPIVEKITSAGLMDKPEFSDACRRIKKLYQQLCLQLSAQKNATGANMSRIRKGKKTLLAYRNSVR